MKHEAAQPRFAGLPNQPGKLRTLAGLVVIPYNQNRAAMRVSFC